MYRWCCCWRYWWLLWLCCLVVLFLPGRKKTNHVTAFVLKKDPSVVFAAIQGLKPYLCLWEREREIGKGIVGSSGDSRNGSSLVPSSVPIFAGSWSSHAVKTGCRIETFFSSSSSSSGGSYPSPLTPHYLPMPLMHVGPSFFIVLSDWRFPPFPAHLRCWVAGWVGLSLCTILLTSSRSPPLFPLCPFSLLFSFLLFSLGWFVVAAPGIIGGHLSILLATNPLSCRCKIEPYPSSSAAVFQLLFHFLFCGSFEVFEIEFVFGCLS